MSDEAWGPSLRSGTPHTQSVITSADGGVVGKVANDHYAKLTVYHIGYSSTTVEIIDAGLYAA
jgi:hypothetical protein